MTFVLSIIAKRPEWGTPRTGAGIDDGNNAVASMLSNLKAVKNVTYEHEVREAAYVRDVKFAIQEFTSQKKFPDIIQLFGHGSAGQLQLGGFWTVEDEHPILGHMVLDSNPDSYGMLTNVVPPSCAVLLLGCNVGSRAPSGYVASGRALLFDLEDMTGADVYAADDLVYPDQLENGFVYKGKLVTSSGKPANPAALVGLFEKKSVQQPPLPTSEIPVLTSLLEAPALGFTPQGGVEVPTDLDVFKRYEEVVPPSTNLLAMIELVFSSKNYDRVEAICCLRYLRARKEGSPWVYFERPSGALAPPPIKNPVPPIAGLVWPSPGKLSAVDHAVSALKKNGLEM